MAKNRFKFTVLDLILILTFLALIVHIGVRNGKIAKFNNDNVEKEAEIILAVRGIDREYFDYFTNGDTIYISDKSSSYTLGSVSRVRSAPAVTVKESDGGFVFTPDFDKVDIHLSVNSKCILDKNGLCITDGRYISPSARFSGDNGKIIFDCSVVSVNLLD